MISKYLYPFYIIGFSALNPRSTGLTRAARRREHISAHKLNCLQRLGNHFRAIALSIFVSASVISCITLQNLDESAGIRQNLIFGHFFPTILYLSSILAIVHNDLFAFNLHSAINNCKILERIFLRHLNRHPQYAKLTSKYHYNVLTRLGMICFSIFIMFIIQISRGTVIVPALIHSLDFCAFIADAYAQFYIDLHNFFMRFLVQTVELAVKTRISRSIAGQNASSTDLIVQLNLYKRIHFELWEVSDIIKKHFGWSFTLFFLKNFIAVSYTMFWIYRTIDSEMQYWILGNYK